MQAPQEVQDLVENFDTHIEAYKSGHYNEQQVRVDYISPLFSALGWDINNKQGFAPNYQDVRHEYTLKTADGTKAPDYCFCIGGVKKFFLEAKKPSVHIKDDIAPAFQIRRYGWTGKLALSILTDFEEFAVYDCRIKPNHNDKASVARIEYFKYTDYLGKWDYLQGIFSKEAIQKGSFDNYITSDSRKKGTTTVDQSFLEDMEGWRDMLARNIALRNPKLSTKELNHLVQATIDRIVFLRICEDREIESYGRLQKLLKHNGIYQELIRFFEQADDKYNSGLFHFKDEKGRGIPDQISLGLKIDDKPLYQIIRKLYYPESPYVFSQIPSEILGQVYEKFLGKVIRLTSSHQAKIEFKPEVRKAGGVYYTPKYIVDYIVKNTVGELLKKKTPVQAKKLKILDPACGSGSFLIGAYQYLLNWYLEQYAKEASKYKKLIYKDAFDQWKLVTKEKKSILVNNIYGVDIDRQAVEVTKLSLLLKVLENENSDTLQSQMQLFHERALPDLSQNIKCGNSLIGTDFFIGKNLELFEQNEIEKINAFDWDGKNGFAGIMQAGGFDAVIGNPPYARLQSLQESQPFAIDVYRNSYIAGSTGNFDIYVLFTEKGYNLLNKSGILGFIEPHKFFQADFGMGLRNFLAEKKALTQVVDFGAEQIFAEATTYTCLLFLSKIKQENFHFINIDDGYNGDIHSNLTSTKSFHLKQPTQNIKWHFMEPQKEKVLQKLYKQPQRLGDVVRKIFQGIPTGSDKIYVLEVEKWDKKLLTCYSKSLEKEIQIEAGFVKPFLMGKDVKRYEEARPKNVVIFPYDLSRNPAILMSEDYMKKNFPNGWAYLHKNKKALLEREKNRFEQTWWQFSRPQNLEEFASMKVMTPEIASFPKMTFDTQGTIYHTTKVYSFSFRDDKNPKYHLGILNSSILWFFLSSTGYVLRGGFYTFKTDYLKPFPIPKLNLSNPTQKSQHDRIVQLVDQMLNVQNKLHTAEPKTDKKHSQQKADILDKQIDTLVYQLYGLTKDEIKVVEENR